jgi:hypothetical protein
LGRKTTLDFKGERRDKILALSKKKKEIIEKLGFTEVVFYSINALCSLHAQ